MATRKKGIVEIPTTHAGWLLILMQSDEYQVFIKEFHKNSPNTIFHHENLSVQLQTLLAEQINNIAKEQEEKNG